MNDSEANEIGVQMRELFPRQSMTQVAAFTNWAQRHRYEVVQQVLTDSLMESKDGFAPIPWIKEQVEAAEARLRKPPSVSSDELMRFREMAAAEDASWSTFSEERRRQIINELMDEDRVPEAFRPAQLRCVSSLVCPITARGRLLSRVGTNAKCAVAG